MENAMQTIQSNAPSRDVGIIADEIRNLKAQAYTMGLVFAIEIGRRLEEAKQALPHGEWGNWLRNEVDFSQSKAENLMKLFREYGDEQITLWGATLKSQTYANLPCSKALLLLAVPREEREEFAEEVGAEDLSVRELKAAIEERDKALKMADMQKKLKEEAAEKWKAAEEARQAAILKASNAEQLQGQLDQMTEQMKREKAAADDIRAKLEDAKKNPTIPKATLDKLKKEAAEAAQKAANEAAKKELEAAQAKAEKATAEAIKAKNAASEAERRAAEAEKKLKTASPEVAAFKALFDNVQASVQKLRGMIETVRGTDPETADKLSKALHAFGASL